MFDQPLLDIVSTGHLPFLLLLLRMPEAEPNTGWPHLCSASYQGPKDTVFNLSFKLQYFFMPSLFVFNIQHDGKF